MLRVDADMHDPRFGWQKGAEVCPELPPPRRGACCWLRRGTGGLGEDEVEEDPEGHAEGEVLDGRGFYGGESAEPGRCVVDAGIHWVLGIIDGAGVGACEGDCFGEVDDEEMARGEMLDEFRADLVAYV